MGVEARRAMALLLVASALGAAHSAQAEPLGEGARAAAEASGGSERV